MKENIEEDMKIVQEFLIEQNKRKQRLIDNPYRQLFYTDEELQAIEHILSDYKRLQEEFKQVDHECERLEQKELRLEKENEELLREKIDNKKIIALAQNEFLGYEQGYQDGKAGRRSATQAIIEGQQYYIIQEQIERYKNQIEKLQKENEELKADNKRLTDEYMIQKHLINAEFLSDYIPKQKIKDKIEELNSITLIKLTKEVDEEHHSLEYMSGYRTGKEKALQDLLRK